MKNQLVVSLIILLSPLMLVAQYNPKGLERAEATIESYKEKNSKFENYFEEAYAYIVFPSIGKGAIGIGAAHGVGTVFELGIPVGKAKLTQVSLGLQFGGQDYSQLIFFETKDDFIKFKKNKLELATQASAVAVKAGASANLSYKNGVAIFSKSKAGLMYEAAFGGQKIKFKPYKSSKKN